MQRRNTLLILLFLTFYALGVYLYATLRFDGNWSENDTMVLTRAIENATAEETILESSRPYGNGLSYQTISLFLIRLSGLDVDTVQFYIYPFITALLPLVAFLAYREMTGNSTAGLLAVLFLYLQPDFLFVTWRGSHEKFTWVLVLLLLFLLIRVFNTHVHAHEANNQRRHAVPYILLFYLSAFAFISSNAFFASSFITALLLSFAAGVIFFAIRARLHPQNRYDDRLKQGLYRLPLVIFALVVLLYLFFFHVYEPSQNLLRAFRSLLEGLSAVFLGTTEAAAPYSYVTSAWVDVRVFLLLTSFSWLMLLVSFIVWCVGAVYLLQRRELSTFQRETLYLWFLYPAFAFQLALGVLADRVGTLGANIQVRLFTPFMLSAMPLVALGMMTLLQRVRPPIFGRAVAGVMMTALFAFSIFAQFKLTNEPLVSNNWIFATEREQVAVNWTLAHSPAENTLFWTGLDRRLPTFAATFDPDLNIQAMPYGIEPLAGTRYYLYSEIERARWERQNLPEVYLDQEFRIYDNGFAQIYARRPRTPYQR